MVSDYLKVVTYFVLSFTNINFFHDSIFHESEIRTVLLEVSIDLGLLKKSLLKTSKIVLMYSNSLLRHFSSMVHAKCLLPNIDRLLLVRSCLQNFYQCVYPERTQRWLGVGKRVISSFTSFWSLLWILCSILSNFDNNLSWNLILITLNLL